MKFKKTWIVPSIKLLKRAELELFDAAKWYEKQQKGLSLKFRAEIKATLDIISTEPLLYSKRYDTDLRFSVVRRFPFMIIFWFDEKMDTVFVVSIFNTNRDPNNYY